MVPGQAVGIDTVPAMSRHPGEVGASEVARVI